MVMPSEKDKILEFKHYAKSSKIYIIYAYIKSLIKKIDWCENNPKKSSTTKISVHIPCGCSMSTVCGFNHIEDKRTLCCGKDCMKKFCEPLRGHAKSITGFKKKNVALDSKRTKIL